MHQQDRPVAFHEEMTRATTHDAFPKTTMSVRTHHHKVRIELGYPPS